MDEDAQLEELRRRRMAEMQAQGGASAEQQYAAQQRAAEAAAQRENILRQILEPEARERLTRVRMARPDIADSLESQLLTLFQQGRVRTRIDDATLRQLLARVTPPTRESTIERR